MVQTSRVRLNTTRKSTNTGWIWWKGSFAESSWCKKSLSIPFSARNGLGKRLLPRALDHCPNRCSSWLKSYATSRSIWSRHANIPCRNLKSLCEASRRSIQNLLSLWYSIHTSSVPQGFHPPAATLSCFPLLPLCLCEWPSARFRALL